MSNENKQLNTIDFTYLYKKTEKLVSALYLLTSFISDKEPVKWQLREAGLKLLAQNLSLSDKPVQGVHLITLILSFLEASYLGGIISEMNHNILKYEFESLIKMVDVEETQRMKGAILSEQFFIVDHGQGSQNNSLASESVSMSPGHKGHNTVSDRLSFKNSNSSVKIGEERLKDKTNRQDIIIGLLKKNKELGIKDFTSAIKDCSEKTIQRELVSLVAKGQVIKEGEKRWSRYLLK